MAKNKKKHGPSLRKALIGLIDKPAALIVYLLLSALIAAVIASYDMPGEFWTILGGALGGGAHAKLEQNRDRKDDDD